MKGSPLLVGPCDTRRLSLSVSQPFPSLALFTSRSAPDFCTWSVLSSHTLPRHLPPLLWFSLQRLLPGASHQGTRSQRDAGFQMFSSNKVLRTCRR